VALPTLPGLPTFPAVTLPPTPAAASDAAGTGNETVNTGARAQLVNRDRLPLSTKGRYIVNTFGERVKWACINWYGSYSPGQWVVGGLEKQKLSFIIDRILEMGFNCIRLSYGTQTYWTNPTVRPEFVAMNPELAGRPFLEVFDVVVEHLTQAGLMVIVNNHVSREGWCCLFSDPEGLWYSSAWNESSWIGSLVGLAARYRHNPLVVAFDLRNEPHDFGDVALTWGDGDPSTDLHLAMTKAGNEVLEVSPNVLIVVEGLCFASDLRPVREYPIVLNIEHRLVYEVHNYLEFQDHTLFSMQVMSYQNLRNLINVGSFLIFLTLVFMIISWISLGAPCPPKGVLLLTLGGIIGGVGLVAFIVLNILMGVFKKMKACSFGINSDYGPLVHYSEMAIVFALLLELLGFYRMWPRIPPSRKAQIECQEYTDSEEDSDSMLPQEATEARRWAKVGCCSAPGWRSVSELLGNWKYCFMHCLAEQDALHHHGLHRGHDRHEGQLDEEEEESEARELSGTQKLFSRAKTENPVVWDRGLCCGLAVFIFLSMILCAAMVMSLLTFFYQSHWAMERKLDKQWGFVLEEGHHYTAPVWMGEFGETIRGNYWNNLLRYFSDRDVDWAYWPLNGRAWKDSFRVIENDDIFGLLTGKLTARFEPKPPEWENETYGILREDYATIRNPWQLLDLQGIMGSPALWSPHFYPCQRDALGPRCGG